MATSNTPLKTVAGAQAFSPYDSNPDWDLDVELQRLLGEELQAMEPTPLSSGSRSSATGAVSAAEGNGGSAASTGMTAGGDAAVASPTASKVDDQGQGVLSSKGAGAAAVGDSRTQAMATRLSEQISDDLDLLYQQITREGGSQRASYDEIANLLQSARAALLNGPASVVEAERLARQAQSLLKSKENSRRWASTFGSLILAYEILFFAAFIGLIVFDRQLAGWVCALTGAVSATSMHDILPFWPTMVWGGIGGVIGGLYSLYWHVTEKQDFDRQYNMWYVVQPIMGAMLGGLVFLIVASGMLAMHSSAPPASNWFPAAIACLCGFRQKFIYELLDKVMEVIGLQPILSKTLKATTGESQTP
jgi:hypothetical protein